MPKRHLSQSNGLEFVHISHTGGFLIEKAAGRQTGINWGACHYIAMGEECPNPDMTWFNPDDHVASYTLHNIWHTPPKDLVTAIPPHQNPYTNNDLFTIVRNPYAKMISEYYSPWDGGYKENAIDKDYPASLNAWVVQEINRIMAQMVKYKLLLQHTPLTENQTAVIKPPAPPQLAAKYLTPQFEYVYDDQGERVIKNVLHYEDLRSEFKALTKKYALEIKLPYRFQESGGELTHLNLYPETIALINEFLRPDFEAFGYEMVESFDNRAAYSIRARSKPCAEYKVGDADCKRDEVLKVDAAKKFGDFPIGLPHATTFMIGILTEMTEEGAKARERIRKTYLSGEDSRLCSWEEYKEQFDSSLGTWVPCRAPYVFYVGVNPEQALKKVDAENMTIERKLVKAATEEEDILYLNIEEATERAKSFAYFKWASNLGDEYHLDFIASVETGTLIHTQKLFKFIDMELPPAPLNRRMFGGEAHGYHGGYYATDPFYFMSLDLAHYIGDMKVKNLNTHSATPALDISKLITYHTKPVKLVNMNPSLFWYTGLVDETVWDDYWQNHMSKLPRKEPFMDTMKICQEFTDGKLIR